jgi:A/G-specific adenine glycosylase
MPEETFRVVVVALIHDGKRRILLGKRSMDEKTLPGIWCPPGGHVEFGKHTPDVLEKNLIREIKEEIGVTVSIESYLDSHSWAAKNYKKITVVFLCKIKSGKPKAKMDTSEVKWFGIKDALRLDLPKIVVRFLRKAEKII